MSKIINKEPKVFFRGEKLSEKQVKILKLLGLGHSNPEIATLLDVSVRTIEYHLYRLRQVLGRKDTRVINERRLTLIARDLIDSYKQYRLA